MTLIWNLSPCEPQRVSSTTETLASYCEAHLVTGDEGPRKFTIDYNGSTLETVGSYVGIGDGQVGHRTNGRIRSPNEGSGDKRSQEREPRHREHEEKAVRG